MRKEDIFQIGAPAEEVYIPFIELVLKYAHKGDRILDIGGGEGVYSNELKNLGFNIICIDTNEDYIKKSLEKGIESYVMDGCNLNFPDNSFDIILLFEVLEHVPDFDNILKEAKRVARKYVLITVPNCGGFEKLKPNITYDHFLASDHVNFFTKEDLEDIFSKHFEKFSVEERESIHRVIGLPNWLNYILSGLILLKIIKTDDIYYRLFSVIEV